MKAIVQGSYGSPIDVLTYTDVDTPTPGEGEVLVRVNAAGVARGDWLIAMGLPYIARPSFGIRAPKHGVAGQEVAGTVEAVGPKATQVQIGDEVFGWCHGAFAEYVAVDQSQLAPKPANITFEEAAAVPVSGFAALQAVRDRGRVQAGQQVLVIGASGGVGSFAVQIAKSFGAEVTGVCSTGNVDMVRSLGADHVIDYTKDDIDGAGRYEVVIDIAGNRSISALRGALTPDGTLVIVGGTGGRSTMGFGRTVWAMALSPLVGQQLLSLISKPNQEDLESLKDLIESGQLSPRVEETYPLDQAPEAVGQLGSGRSRGKRVVTM